MATEVGIMESLGEGLGVHLKAWGQVAIRGRLTGGHRNDVLHADLHGGRVVLLDWDEARVNVPWFDLAHLPIDPRLPDGLDLRDVESAGIAWEAATCWASGPEYARSRVDELVHRM